MVPDCRKLLTIALLALVAPAQSRPESREIAGLEREPTEALVAKLTDAAASRPTVLLVLAQRARRARNEVAAPESAPATESRAARLQDAKRTLEVLAASVRTILPALESDDWRERADASWIFANVGAPAAATVPRLLELFKDPWARVRENASLAVAEIGSPGIVSDLVEALDSSDPKVRQNVTWAFYKMGGPEAEGAMPQLIKRLGDEVAMVRANAADALSNVGASAQAAVPALMKLLADPDARVRDSASRAVATIIPKSVDTIPDLVRALGSPDPNVRQNLTWGIGRMGERAVEALPALVARLADERETTRSNAASAIGGLEDKAKSTEPALSAALKVATPGARRSIAWALAKIRPVRPESAGPLIDCLRDPDADVRQDATWALGTLGPHAQDAVAPLIALLVDEREATRVNAAQALAAIGGPARSAAPAILGVLRRENAVAISGAADALQRLGVGAAASVRELIRHLSSADAGVRTAACGALGGWGAHAAAARPFLLLLLLAEGGDATVTRALASIAVDFGTVSRRGGSEMIQSFDILAESDSVITGITISHGKVTARYEFVPDRQCFSVTVILGHDVPAGRLRALVSIATTDPAQRVIMIPVFGKVPR